MIRSIVIALALGVTAAPAAVIYGVVPENQRLFVQGQLPFDFNEDGTNDLTFLATTATFQFISVQPSAMVWVFIDTEYSDNGAGVLLNGTEISAANLQGRYSAIPGKGAQISAFYDNGNGPVLEGPWARRSGYLGFSFYTQSDEARHYGWFRIDEIGGALVLHDWAYETVDSRAIIAGQIPEPSVFLLGSLAGAGLVFRRTRRRNAEFRNG